MKQTLKQLGVGLAIVCMASSLSACKRPPKGERRVKRTVKASIAEFDPNSEVKFDLSKYGSQRVDEWLVQEAFNRSFDGLDRCVAAVRGRLKVGGEDVLEGDVDFVVQLNPESDRPFAVSATISNPKLDGDKILKDCLRDAVAEVKYPKYDGPPQVAEFSTQLDPGYE